METRARASTIVETEPSDRRNMRRHEDLVSVVVLCRNRPEKLSRCIDSLLRQRTSSDVEILVVDDGSRAANRPAIDTICARDARIQLERQPHRGISAARNHGVVCARGGFVAIVADDYVLHESYLEDGICYLRRHQDAAVVRFRIGPLHDDFGSRVSHCYYDASIAYRLELEHGLRSPYWRSGTQPSLRSGPTSMLEASGGALFRASVFESVGPFDESLERGEDTEFTERLRGAGLQVHFVDLQRVANHYDRWPTDTLRKCLLTGYWREQLLSGGSVAGWSRWRSLGQKVFGVRHAFRRAGRATGWTRRLLYLPWMLTFEAATLAGHATAWLGPRPRRRTTAQSHGGPPEPSRRNLE